MRRLLPLLWAILTLGIVAAVVWAGLRKLPDRSGSAVDLADAPASTRPAFCKAGHDYYVLVKLVEFYPTKSDGSAWDRGVTGGSVAPDAKVLLLWHGQQVFSLPKREDQLISTWDLFRVNIADVAMSGGNVDVTSSINAPVVTADAKSPVTIEVYDNDVVRDDLAMKTELTLTELPEGEIAITPPKGSGVRRLIVQLIDRQTPLSDLIALAGKR